MLTLTPWSRSENLKKIPGWNMLLVGRRVGQGGRRCKLYDRRVIVSPGGASGCGKSTPGAAYLDDRTTILAKCGSRTDLPLIESKICEACAAKFRLFPGSILVVNPRMTVGRVGSRGDSPRGARSGRRARCGIARIVVSQPAHASRIPRVPGGQRHESGSPGRLCSQPEVHRLDDRSRARVSGKRRCELTSGPPGATRADLPVISHGFCSRAIDASREMYNGQLSSRFEQ